jgi:hypothetical protein
MFYPSRKDHKNVESRKNGGGDREKASAAF